MIEIVHFIKTRPEPLTWYARIMDSQHVRLLHIARGAARIFLRGGLKLWKQRLWKGKIACHKNSQESTYIVDKQLTVLTTKPGVLPTKLPSCFSYSFMTTVKRNHLDYMSQPSLALICDFFLLSESLILTSTFSSLLQSLRNASNFSAQNWWYWRVWWDFNLLSPFSNFCELILLTCQGP